MNKNDLRNRTFLFILLLFTAGAIQIMAQDKPQTPHPPFDYFEEPVTVWNRIDSAQLSGTLTIPKVGEKHPLIYLIPGANPFDRDQSLAGHHSFRLWADHLTKKGFATLRMDDRGVGKSKGSKMISSYELLSQDILSALASVITDPRIDTSLIGLLGHSQGSSLAVLTAERSKDIDYLVLLGSTGMTLLDNMAYQEAADSVGDLQINLSITKTIRSYLSQKTATPSPPASLDDEITTYISKLNKKDKSAASSFYNEIKPFLNMFAAIPMGRDALTFDQNAYLEKTRIPVLAITGSQDPLVVNLPSIEKSLTKAKNSNFTIFKMENLNHMLQHSETPDDGNPAAWVKNEETVNPEVLSKVSSWIIGLTERQNFAQWRGDNRDGSYFEENLLNKWPEEGPPIIWESEEMGRGWGSPGVTTQAIYILGTKNKTDYCTALDLNGHLLWQSPIGEAWQGSYENARSTPTVQGNYVYTVSGKGWITCLDANTGSTVWQINGYQKFKGHCTLWGVCESPLLVEDKLIYTPGGSQTTMVALDKHTGKTIWTTQCLQDSSAYVSPLAVHYANKTIIATITANCFLGVDADNAEILWKYKYSDLKWEQNHWYTPIINCNTPLYSDGEFFISKGYDHLGATFKMNPDGTGIELMRTDSVLDVHVGGMVLYDGYIYGSNWINNNNGNWCCIDWETGKKMYETHWESKGSIILADGMLYCYDEKKGNLALVKPNPQQFEIVSSFRVKKGHGPYWTHPVIKNGALYIRRGNLLMAFDIRQL